MSEVRHIQVNESWLVNDELHVCLVQTPPPSMAEIRNDAARPNNVALVRDLLEGRAGGNDRGPTLTELLPGTGPGVVLFPEYSFGSDDWTALDTAVRTCTRPLVFLAGFGAVSGGALKAWANSAAPQRVLLEDTAGLADSSRYNGAWCWVHLPHSQTVCYCFLKAFPEQRIECTEMPDIETGTIQPLLEFEDLLLAPGICADLLCRQSDNWLASLQSRLRRELDGCHKRLLITGMLLEPKVGHPLWQNAIDRLLTSGDDAMPVVLALANHATGAPRSAEDEDRWRSQSGVFCSTRLLQEQDHMPAVRKIRDRSFLGVLVRRTEPGAVGGKARWSYGSDTGRFLWRAGHCVNVTPDGRSFGPPVSDSGADYECLHTVQRLELPTARGDARAAPFLVDDRNALTSFLADGSIAPGIFSSLFVGLEKGTRPGIPASRQLCRWLKENAWVDKSRTGLTALLFLHSEGLGAWADEGQPGQLHGDNFGRHVHALVWTNPTLSGNAMRREIEKWINLLSDPLTLLVVGDPGSGQLPTGRVIPEARDEITEADDCPARGTAEITEAKDNRRAYACPLGFVGNYFPWTDGHADGLVGAIERMLGS